MFEHIKYNTNPDASQTSKTVKNHAAGAHERQDAYLYGHPEGRKKRFRSPNEFFPHLLWLATDDSGDHNNCNCKVCTPEELELDEKDTSRSHLTTETSESSKAKAPALSRPSDVLKQPPKERKPSIQQQPQPIVQQLPSRYPQPSQIPARPAATTTPPAVTPRLEPSMLPRARTMEQKADMMPQKHIYRPGEVVWFKKGQAWGLGAVQYRDNGSTPASYRVQPLSHPLSHPSMVTVAQTELRPWLAWSPPPATCRALNPDHHNNFRSLTYDNIDWNAYMAGAFGPGEGEVDGSILAAKQVETTYTPFEPMGTSPIPNTPQPQGQQTHYNGIFIGAEKIWVGDALRLRTGKFATDIVVLHDIIEQPSSFAPQAQQAQSGSQTRIILVGDTYSTAVAELNPQLVPQTALHLPSRVRDDLGYKNQLTSHNPDPKKRYTSFWRLTAKSCHLSIGDIKGRWYESSLLLPIIDPQTFAERHMKGDMPDACNYMNGQGDCNRPAVGAPGMNSEQGPGQTKSRPANVRAGRREEAFGAAVPQGWRIHWGLDEGRGSVRPGSSGNGHGDWMDPNNNSTANVTSRPGSTRPGSSASSVAMRSTPATSTGSLPGFGREYSSQEVSGDGGDRGGGLFQDGMEGIGEVSMKGM